MIRFRVLLAKSAHTWLSNKPSFLKKLNLERLTVRMGSLNSFTAHPFYDSNINICHKLSYEKYITVNPNRTFSLFKFSFFKPLHLLSDQNLPDSGTFDLSLAFSRFLSFFDHLPRANSSPRSAPQ